MNKMKNVITKTFVLLLFSISGFAQIDNYTYKRKLNAVTKENYYTIPLSPEITAHTKSNFNDFRLYTITNEDTTEIPYLLEMKGDKTEQSSVLFELINNVSNQKCCSFVTFKLNKKQVINTIHLDVLESNFDKIITIEGSNDNKEWFTIKEHLRIVGFDNNLTHFRSTVLQFPAAEYMYYRIKLDDDASKKITISNASVFENKTTKGNYSELLIKNKAQAENDKEKTTETIIELNDNHWLSYLTIDAENKTDYYRNINIYSSNGTYNTEKGIKETWKLISSGVISSKFDNTFSLNGNRSKRLKIEVENYNDSPVLLNQLKVFSEKSSLITKLPVCEYIYMCYGKENDNAPIYDMVHFKDKIPTSLSEIAYSSEQVKIVSIEKKSPFIENKKWLWIAMGAVILIIGYFSLTMLKKEQE